MLSEKTRKYSRLFKALLNETEELTRINNYDDNRCIERAFRQTKKRPDPGDKILFDELHSYRGSLLQNKTSVTFEVFDSSKTSDISTVCKKAASPIKWCHFFYYFSKACEAERILELGTNLGVSGQYFITPLKDYETSMFITMEAHPLYCKIAKARFDKIAPQVNTKVVEGFYENTLDKVLEHNDNFDLVFIDGHHQKKATLTYFNKIKSRLNDGAFLIFDDINWSNDMRALWEIIKEDPNITFTVDFYKLGIIQYSKSRQSAHTNHFQLFLTL